MNLVEQFSAIKQADTQTRVDYAVAKKMLDSQKTEGDAAVKLIQAAAQSKVDGLRAISSLGESGVSGLGENLNTVG